MNLYQALKPLLQRRGARCPCCRETGYLRVLPGTTIRTPDGISRERVCLNCGYHFETEMKMDHQCPCGCRDFHVPKTKHTRSGIIRIYKCSSCGMQQSTVEPLPVPDEIARERRRRIGLQYA